MKLLRIWLLVLLATLIPVRGAVAAAMLCSAAGPGSQGELRVMDPRAAGGVHDAEAQAHHRHDGGAGHDHKAAQKDKCNLCAASCALTPLLSEPAGISEPRDLADVPFPSITAPAPSFLSGGQERPPRSI